MQTISKTKQQGFPRSFKLLQKPDTRPFRDSFYFGNYTQGVPDILPNYFKNQTQKISEFLLSNYFKNKIRRNYSFRLFQKQEKGSSRFFRTTSTTKQKESSRFLQTYIKNQVQDYFRLLQKQNKGSQRIFQTTLKTKQESSSTSKTRRKR